MHFTFTGFSFFRLEDNGTSYPTLPYHRTSTLHISHPLKPAGSVIGTKALPPASNSTVFLQTNYLTSSRLRANLSTAAEQKPPSLQGKETTPCRQKTSC